MTLPQRICVLALLIAMVGPSWAVPEDLVGTWKLFQMRRHDYSIEPEWELSLRLTAGGEAFGEMNSVAYARQVTESGCDEVPYRGPSRSLRGTYRVEGDHLLFQWDHPESAPSQLFGSDPSHQVWPFRLDNALRVTLSDRWLLLIPEPPSPTKS